MFLCHKKPMVPQPRHCLQKYGNQQLDCNNVTEWRKNTLRYHHPRIHYIRGCFQPFSTNYSSRE